MKKEKLREHIQKYMLLGLSRQNFFKHAAFYGGTALRILYGLDRFSEDLDFSLLQPNLEFDFSIFLEGLHEEMTSLGFEVDVTIKKNSGVIHSAFLKRNTLKMLLAVGKSNNKGLHRDEKIKIKLEVDINPPMGFGTKIHPMLSPAPFYVTVYQLSDLFAGKLHAILCRAWKNRVKGRDWYDLIWFVKRDIPVNLSHLSSRLKQSANWPAKKVLTHDTLIALLQKKIATINWEYAKEDICRFINDTRTVDLWSASFFIDVTKFIKSTW